VPEVTRKENDKQTNEQTKSKITLSFGIRRKFVELLNDAYSIILVM